MEERAGAGFNGVAILLRDVFARTELRAIPDHPR
jgi:hypothetical protein